MNVSSAYNRTGRSSLKPNQFTWACACVPTAARAQSPSPNFKSRLGPAVAGESPERRREEMAATLLPTLSPPLSRAAAAFLLLRRAPAKPFSCLRPPPALRRSLSSASSSSPATAPPALRPLSTVASSSTAARAAPARRDLLMLGIETSCDDTAAAVVLVLASSSPVDFTCGGGVENPLCFCAELLRCCLSGCLQVRGDGEILSQVVSSQVSHFPAQFC